MSISFGTYLLSFGGLWEADAVHLKILTVVLYSENCGMLYRRIVEEVNTPIYVNVDHLNEPKQTTSVPNGSDSHASERHEYRPSPEERKRAEDHDSPVHFKRVRLISRQRRLRLEDRLGNRDLVSEVYKVVEIVVTFG